MSPNAGSKTTFLEPFAVDIDLEAAAMRNVKNRISRHASDMRGYYTDATALEHLIKEFHDPLHYEVEEYTLPPEYGHLMFCISRLQPGLIGTECFMTKGHYHTVTNTGETYLCLQGSGYLLLKTQDGRFHAEPMKKGRMVYAPPYWAHRSVNTGDEPLVSYCVYPAEAGHNYGDIEDEGFLKRVFKENGNVLIREAE